MDEPNEELKLHNEELKLQIEDAIALAKVLHRVTYGGDSGLGNGGAWGQLASQAKVIDINFNMRIKPAEAQHLVQLLPKMNALIRVHKEQARKELESLGEQMYLHGDGILRVEREIPDDSFREEGQSSTKSVKVFFRVFSAGVAGTIYWGEFGSLEDAKRVWHEKTNKHPSLCSVDLYRWAKIENVFGEVEWKICVYEEVDGPDDLWDSSLGMDRAQIYAEGQAAANLGKDGCNPNPIKPDARPSPFPPKKRCDGDCGYKSIFELPE